MKIQIEFNSIWQNSFLEDTNSKKRKFVATSKAKNLDMHRKITKTTILGVLSRLIGDQRPLKMARESDNFYFSDIENLISDPIVNESYKNNENVMLINKSEYRAAQKTFLGTIDNDTKMFFSQTAPMLWSVLYLPQIKLFDFILSDKYFKKEADSNPLSLVTRLENISNHETITLYEEANKEIEEKISKEKKKKKPNQENIGLLKKELMELNSEEKCSYYAKLKHVITKLNEEYPEVDVVVNNKINPMVLYISSLYLQVSRMIKKGFDLAYCKKDDDQISIHGFAKKSMKFNGIRDFLNKYAGNRKKTSKTPVIISKSSGTLQIILDIPREKAKELKQLIENAGVSSFYLGKKGLAYVTNIDIREVQR